MALTYDPQIAAALAPLAGSGFNPPAVGDIEGRRANAPAQSTEDRGPASARASP